VGQNSSADLREPSFWFLSKLHRHGNSHWRHISALDFRFDGRRFESLSLPSGCFLRQEASTLDYTFSLHPGVQSNEYQRHTVGWGRGGGRGGNPAMD